MAVKAQKLRMLYIYSILLEKTDEEHILSAGDLISILRQRYDMEADRRSVYGDIETLNAWEADIIIVKGKEHGYFIGNRVLEIPELKMIVDSLQVSKPITEKKTEELIRKLETLVSEHQAKQLQKQVILYNRPKAQNESIFYTTDQLHSAIYQNRKIEFQYAEWTTEKTYRLRHNGRLYTVSPWNLLWDDENYYLIAYQEEYQSMRHYRVDKIMNLHILDETRAGAELAQFYDPASFEKKTFGMFSGKEERVTLLCENRLAGVIIDRFGTDLMMPPADREHFRVTVPISVSRQFFGWMAAIGEGLEIVRPQSVREEYRDYLRKLLARYNE